MCSAVVIGVRRVSDPEQPSPRPTAPRLKPWVSPQCTLKGFGRQLLAESAVARPHHEVGEHGSTMGLVQPPKARSLGLAWLQSHHCSIHCRYQRPDCLIRHISTLDEYYVTPGTARVAVYLSTADAERSYAHGGPKPTEIHRPHLRVVRRASGVTCTVGEALGNQAGESASCLPAARVTVAPGGLLGAERDAHRHHLARIRGGNCRGELLCHPAAFAELPGVCLAGRSTLDRVRRWSLPSTP